MPAHHRIKPKIDVKPARGDAPLLVVTPKALLSVTLVTLRGSQSLRSRTRTRTRARCTANFANFRRIARQPKVTAENRKEPLSLSPDDRVTSYML